MKGKKRKPFSEEAKRNMSVAKKKYWKDNKGKKHLSEEAKKKLSEAQKKRLSSNESRKKMSEEHKGQNQSKHWFNNGETNVFCFECPEGFVTGQLRNNA